MFTPEILSTKPSGCDYATPSYDWNNQSSGLSCAGSYTMHSMQTFDSYGKPQDAEHDNND